MEKIGKFFDKFRNKASSQIKIYTVISEVLKNQMGIDVEMKDILISNGTVKIKTSQLIKNEIFIRKSRLLKEISEKLGGQKIVDIQ